VGVKSGVVKIARSSPNGLVLRKVNVKPCLDAYSTCDQNIMTYYSNFWESGFLQLVNIEKRGENFEKAKKAVITGACQKTFTDRSYVNYPFLYQNTLVFTDKCFVTSSCAMTALTNLYCGSKWYERG
jgi:hypothetical protein